jgi:WXXGXW repeat (2 copies)
MNHHFQRTMLMKVYMYCLVAALLGTAVAWGQERGAPRGRTEAADGVEVLTRGPVHEAFAETIAFDPEPGIVVAKAAPDPIEELPPEQKPDGANVEWIPGYWAWDDERTDFLWVSGIWRALPPGRQWVPGYWGQSGRGSQWISGYWADAKASEIDYLPEPPQTVEAGPNINAPSADHTWLPGCWVWQQNRYAWRPGYWATAQPNWVWIPAHYVWSPRGYVFVDGYYDHSVARRGVLFAPVYFNASVYSRRGFSYSPVTAINPAVFTSHLFLRPSYGHYYFGDYYGSNYTSLGFSPWFSYYSGRRGYDPFYAHQRWHHRNDREWDRRVEADFAHRRDHDEARPPRTWTAQLDRSTRDAANIDKTFAVAASLDELAKSQETPIRFQPVAKLERQQFGQRGQEVRSAREERQKLEAAAADPSASATVRNAQPVKVKLPKAPIAAQGVEKFGKDDAPPQRHEVLKPDLNIAPKARTAGGKAASPPEPTATKREPRPEQPKASKRDSRPVQPTAEPKASKPEPRSERPKAQPSTPKAEPRVERPRAESRKKSQSESKGPPPGRSNDKQPSAPQGKSEGESKNNPKQ